MRIEGGSKHELLKDNKKSYFPALCISLPVFHVTIRLCTDMVLVSFNQPCSRNTKNYILLQATGVTKMYDDF